MDLDPRRLRVLRAIALRGSVKDAAYMLNLTASAVSQQLMQLETEVGISLIDRTQRRATLTPAGELLALRAERVEQELEEAKRELSALTGLVSGSVTIIGFETAIRFLLVPACRILARTHPDLHPHLVEELDAARALRELRTGGADLVIAEHIAGPEGERVHADLEIRPLLDDEYRIVVPASWALVPASIPELTTIPWIVSPPEFGCGQVFKHLTEKYAFTPKCAHHCTEFTTTLALVAAGLGAAILPKLALEGIDPANIAFSTLPTSWSRRLNIVHRKPRFGPEPKVSTVVLALDEAARAMGYAPVA